MGENDVVRVCVDRVSADGVVLRALDGTDRVLVARARTREDARLARDVDAWQSTRARRRKGAAPSSASSFGDVMRRYVEYVHWMIVNMVTFESMCCVIVDGARERRSIGDAVDDEELCAIFAITNRDENDGETTYEFTSLRRQFVYATLRAIAIAVALGFPLYCEREVVDARAMSAHHGALPKVFHSFHSRRGALTHAERMRRDRYSARLDAMRRERLAQRSLARALDVSRDVDRARAYDHVLHQRLRLAIALRREREEGLSVEDIELRNFHSHAIARCIDDCVYSGDRKPGFVIMALENAILDEDYELCSELRDTLCEMNTATAEVRDLSPNDFDRSWRSQHWDYREAYDFE